MSAYTTVYKDIRVTNKNTYDLCLRVNDKFFHQEFNNINTLFNFCKEMELKAILDLERKEVKRWSDD